MPGFSSEGGISPCSSGRSSPQSPRQLSPRNSIAPPKGPISKLSRASSGLKCESRTDANNVDAEDSVLLNEVKRASARSWCEFDMWVSLFRETLPGEAIIVEKHRSDSKLGVSFNESMIQHLPNLLVIYSVKRGSPAARAGIGAFDRILSINGEPVESASSGLHMMWQAPAGPVQLQVRRCQARLHSAAFCIQRAWRLYSEARLDGGCVIS